MIVKKLQNIVNVLKDGLISIYLYQKGTEKIPVFVVNAVDFVFLDSIRSFFAREKFILLTQDDIFTGSDVFCLKFLHIKNHSDLFYGNDVLSTIPLNVADMRSVLELEIRTKRIQLREEYLSQDTGRNFLQHLLPGMQIIREGALFLKSPHIDLPKDMKALLSLFDVAWSCNSQFFYYLIDDTVKNNQIPSLIHDVDVYLAQLCTKINDFTL